jgi:hypothetical protein
MEIVVISMWRILNSYLSYVYEIFADILEIRLLSQKMNRHKFTFESIYSSGVVSANPLKLPAF